MLEWGLDSKLASCDSVVMEDAKALIDGLPVSAAELARRLKVSSGTVHDWRSGRRKLTVEMAAEIERQTGVYGVVAEIVKRRTAA